MFDYQDYLKTFKEKARSKKLTAADMAELAIHKAIKAKNNDKVSVALNQLYGSFTAITNKNRLANGCTPYDTLKNALQQLNGRSAFSDVYKEQLGEDYLKVFRDLLNQIRQVHFEDTTYAYIFVKQDMSREQQMVQCGHVAMVLGQYVSKDKYDAKQLHFVVFGVADEKALIAKAIKLTTEHSIKYVTFVEPDQDDQLTAIACLPMKKSYAVRKKLFDEDKLLVME